MRIVTKSAVLQHCFTLCERTLLRSHNNSFRPKLGQSNTAEAKAQRLRRPGLQTDALTDTMRTFSALQVSLCTCAEGSVVIFKGCVQLLNKHLEDYACARTTGSVPRQGFANANSPSTPRLASCDNA